METLLKSSKQNKENTILPNFMIVGAAKCGTSSLYQYLSQHPEIFMSKVKEPRFVSSQFTSFPLNGPGDDKVEAWYVKSYHEYLQLFKGAGKYKAVGEASADNLYFYEHAIPVIKQYIGEPKIIIILRDPVKRAFSAYQHLCRDNRESLSFKEALQQEQERIKNNWELIYYYTEVGRYYQQVKAYMQQFEHVKVVLNEDLNQRPQQTLQEILEFLEVDSSFQFDISLKHNISGIPKSRWLHQLLSSENIFRKIGRPFTRLLFNEKKREAMVHKLNAFNLTKLEARQESSGIDLKAIFQEDVNKLSKLLNKDLSIWKLTL